MNGNSESSLTITAAQTKMPMLFRAIEPSRRMLQKLTAKANRVNLAFTTLMGNQRWTRCLRVGLGNKMLHTLITSLLPVLVIIAAASDVMSLRIPNWLTLTTALLFFPMALITHMPLEVFGWHLLAGALLFAAGFVFFSFGLFGGGDAKLLAAAGLWFGTAQTAQFLVLTVVAGGVLAAIVGAWAALQIDWYVKDSSIGKKFADLKPNVPYGFAIAVGAIMAYPGTWWMGGLA
jgi:prepilin peptidase CpaA